MNNEYILPADADPQPFIEKFSQELDTNLSDKIIKTLSNILALDYASRLKKEIEITEHVNRCVARITEYIGHKVITDESFSTSMTLFTIAISEKKEEQIDKAQQQLVEDIALESFITMHFGDISEAEKAAIKSLLKELSAGKDSHEIINFIHSNPKLFYSIVVSALKEKKKQQEITEFAYLHVHKLIKESKVLEQKNNKIVNIGSKISLMSGLMALISGGATLGSELLATILLPVTATAVKYSPAIGEEVGKVAAKNIPALQKSHVVLEQVKSDIIELSGKSQTVADILSTSHSASLETIKERLQQQKASLEQKDLSHSGKVQKDKLMNKETGRGFFN